MNYVEILKSEIRNKHMSLSAVSRALHDRGIKIDKSYLSKLTSGKKAPASDKVNEALAEVLGIDPLELKAAAYREKIPSDVLEKLKENTA